MGRLAHGQMMMRCFANFDGACRRGSVAGKLLVGLGVLALLLWWPWLYIVWKQPHEGDQRSGPTRAEVQNLGAALDAYRGDTGGYPTTEQGLGALVACPAGVAGWHGKYIDEVPVDKWGTAYRYACPMDGDATRFSLVSAGRDKVFGTEDDMELGTGK